MEELSEGPSTTTTLTESQITPSLPVTSIGPVVAVTSISEQVSSVAVDTGEEDPPPAKRKPQPIVWSGQGSCKCDTIVYMYVYVHSYSCIPASMYTLYLHVTYQSLYKTFVQQLPRRMFIIII